MDGVLKDKEDSRDFIKEIPENVEKVSVNLLDGLDYKLKNQETSSACTGFAASHFYSILFSKVLGYWEEFNPWFTYYFARNEAGIAHRDAGAYPRDVFKVSKDKGALIDGSGDVWGALSKPSDEDVKRASKLKIKSYFRIPNNKVENGVIHTLTIQGLPVYISMKLYKQSWKECRKTGILKSIDGDTHDSNHAMCIYGYDSETDEYLVVNSHGVIFGDEGKLRMSSEYLRKNINDCWTVGYDYF